MNTIVFLLFFQPVTEPVLFVGGRAGVGISSFEVPPGDFGIPLGPKFVASTSVGFPLGAFARLSLRENGHEMNVELGLEYQTQTIEGNSTQFDIRGEPYDRVTQSRTLRSVHVPLTARWSLHKSPISGGFLVSFNGQFTSDFSLETETTLAVKHDVKDQFYFGFGVSGLWNGVQLGDWSIPFEARLVVNTKTPKVERTANVIVLNGAPAWEMQFNTGFNYAFNLH